MSSRGEIWFADLEPVEGHEQNSQRPVLIVSVDAFNNGPATLVVIIPITSKNRNIPFHVEIYPPEGGLNSTSYIMCDHIRSISKTRLKKRLGQVTDITMENIEQRLKILLQL